MTVTFEESTWFPGVVAGWAIDRPFQYEFGGLVFGSGTPYIVTEVNGLYGWEGNASDLRSDNNPGSIPGLLTPNPKTIEFAITVDGDSGTIEDLTAAARRAFQVPPREYNNFIGDFAVHGGFPISGYGQLAFLRPGFTTTRTIYCRVRRIAYPSNFDLANGRAEITVQFEANDPISYSMSPKVVTATMEASDLSFELTLTNEGDFIDGYSPYIFVASEDSDAGFKNPSFSRTYPDRFHEGEFLTDTLKFIHEFPSAGDTGWLTSTTLGLSFKHRVTEPFPMAQYIDIATPNDRWWRVRPSTYDTSQVFKFERDSWGSNAALTVMVVTRDAWL